MNGSLPETTSNSAPLSAERLIDLLRTLADPIRLRIIRLLEQQAHHGLSVGELAEVLKLPQSTVSRHLKTLSDAGLSEARRDGTSMLYRLADPAPMASGNVSRQLRSLARQHLEHDAQSRTDTQRLAHILRQRESMTEKFFGKHAPQWDTLRAQWFGESFHLEALLCLLDPEWIVADLGTGTGAMLPVIAPHVKQVIAVDPSPAMLKGARVRIREQQLGNVELRQGAIERLPIEDHAVDVAIVALVLAYLPDPAAALREVRRIVKPGGLTLIIDLQPHAVEMFREKLHHQWMGFPQAQMQGWLKEAGFTRVRWHPVAPAKSRSKEGQVPVPDLFVMRAEVAGA